MSEAVQAKELYDKLIAKGFQLSVKGDGLIVSPRSALSPEGAEMIRLYKPQLMELLGAKPAPYIDEAGDLWIPMKSHPRFHYWSGGQPLVTTLAELNAPLSVWKVYAVRRDDLLVDDGHNKRCQGLVEFAGEVFYCPECKSFLEVKADVHD